MFKPIYHCRIEFSPSPHLNQIYDGFWKLKQKGIIKLESKRIKLFNGKPVIKVIVDKKHTLIYDTLDGLNWIEGSLKDNLEYFRSSANCDLYFKRSFIPVLQDYTTKAKIYPLGMNFPYKYDGDYPITMMERLNQIIKQKIKKIDFKSSNYEYLPIVNRDSKILFLCGLWNPDDVNDPELKLQREQINNDRMTFVRECKAEFGSQFTGGIQINDYSRQIAADILAPLEITNKRNYISNIKAHNICIATTGLHNSTGWKFAEYMAASRAIITEPLKYELPGDFQNGKNYLNFNNISDLITRIYSLLNDKNKMQTMMYENFKYYNRYINSEMMILNTLLKIRDI